jgi:hypothetical protein
LAAKKPINTDMKNSPFIAHAFAVSLALTAILLSPPVSATSPKTSQQPTELHDLFKFNDGTATQRSPAAAVNAPEDLIPFFVVEAPADRGPASVRKSASNQPKKKGSNPDRRSRLPASVKVGFELRVKHENLVSMFWVAKREDRYDLLYANSSGSRVNVGLTPENFGKLHDLASGIKSAHTNVKNCPNSIMQIHVLDSGRKERTITACVTSKSKSAEELRVLGATLAGMVH